MNKMYKKYAAITSGVTLAILSGAASAASLLPANTLNAVTTDSVDTVKDLAIQGLPLVTGVALAWFIVTGVKSLLSRGGIR